MFLLKKIFGIFLDPLLLCLAVLIAGVVLLWVRKRQRMGKVFIGIGIAILLVTSTPWVPALLIGPLEQKYPALLNPKGLPAIKWVVVLGGGVTDDRRISVNSRLDNAALARLVEGMRIYHSIPGTRLIVSGGAWRRAISEAEVMAAIAASMGIDKQNIIMEPWSLDTDDEARLVRKMVGDDAFVLVTSASHMPRSMALFRKQGMHPVPAPTDFKIRKDASGGHAVRFVPSPTYLLMVHLALHEYFGMAWAKLRGKI